MFLGQVAGTVLFSACRIHSVDVNRGFRCCDWPSPATVAMPDSPSLTLEKAMNASLNFNFFRFQSRQRQTEPSAHETSTRNFTMTTVGIPPASQGLIPLTIPIVPLTKLLARLTFAVGITLAHPTVFLPCQTPVLLCTGLSVIAWKYRRVLLLPAAGERFATSD